MTNQNNDVTFDLSQVERTFTQYKLNQILDGVVVAKREDGVVFNIGGKLDAFIPKADFEDFSLIKFGDRFKVIITNMKNEEGLIEVSKSKADGLILGTMQASGLKIGKSFSFVVTKYNEQGLIAKLGEFDIIVPTSEIDTKPYNKNLKQYIGKKYDGLVTDIDTKNKQITASIKMLSERTKQTIEISFWNAVFVGKLVSGKVIKIMPYGAFVDVYGVTCFCHISQVAHTHTTDISSVLNLNQEYTFKIIEINKEDKKVALSLKALQASPKQEVFASLQVGQTHKGKVVRFLPFGAIVKLENGIEGLLHINEASILPGTLIQDITKLNEEIDVTIKSIDQAKQKVSFELNPKR